MIFHITTCSEWQQAREIGEYRVASLETEGFIHCSEIDQVAWVANQFYQNVPDLVLLQVNPEKLTAELRYDEIETGDRFPHIYGALNLEAVEAVIDFYPDSEGRFQLPPRS